MNEKAKDHGMTWVGRHPGIVALVAFISVVIPGFARVEYIANETQSTAESNVAAIERSDALIECLTAYATEMTDALQDRDAINIIGRGASEKLWRSFKRYIQNPTTGTPEERQRRVLATVNEYLDALDAITRTSSLNPYPDPEVCFRKNIAPAEVEAMFALASSPRTHGEPGTWDDKCWGRPVTLRGTRGADLIHGTDGNDVIWAYSGDDLIVSGGGNDVVCGRWGSDFINSGSGFDYVDCGRGDDRVQQEERRRYCEGG